MQISRIDIHITDSTCSGGEAYLGLGNVSVGNLMDDKTTKNSKDYGHDVDFPVVICCKARIKEAPGCNAQAVR